MDKINVNDKLYNDIEIYNSKLTSQIAKELAFERILKRMKPVMASCINKSFKTTVSDYDDLKQIASLAVFKAVQQFDSKKNASFVSYAYTKIKYDLFNEFKKETKYLNGLSDKDIDDIIEFMEMDDSTDISLEYERIYNKFTDERLAMAYAKLTDIEKKVIDKVYFEDKNFSQIAKEQNKTREAIRQTHDRAIRKLKQNY